VVEPVDRMLKAWQRLDRGRMICQLIGVTDGQQIELSRDHVVTVFRTTHTVPSVGYVVWQRRRKLKPEYQGMTGDQIRELRLSGTDVTHELRTPFVCYTGDTSPAGLDAYLPAFQAKILIIELTFFRPDHRREKIHKFGHLHLDDFLERADRFQNELIIAMHFSTRYPTHQIEKSVMKRLPPQLRERVKLWL
jgi:ribonuclease Z